MRDIGIFKYFVERGEDFMWVYWLLHGFGLGVMAIFYVGNILAKFFEEGDEFCYFLFDDQIDLQIQPSSLLGDIILAILCNENKGGH